MPSWKKSRIIHICPVCGGAEIKLAKDGQGAQRPENRVLYCPECYEAFTWDDLQMRWKANQRPDLAPEGYNWTEPTPGTGEGVAP